MESVLSGDFQLEDLNNPRLMRDEYTGKESRNTEDKVKTSDTFIRGEYIYEKMPLLQCSNYPKECVEIAIGYVGSPLRSR
jgi:hypothetical protein